MASANFTNVVRHLMNGLVKFDGTQNFKVLLVSSVPSQANLDAWVNRSDVTNEITGTGYSAGGIAQAFTLLSLNTTLHRQEVDFTDIANGWTSATFSAVGAIIYLDSGSAATDKLLCFEDFGGTVSVTSGSFSITYTSNFYLQA